MSATPKAMIELFGFANGKRRRFFLVERAASRIVFAFFSDGGVGAHHVDDIGLRKQVLDEILGDALAHGRFC